MRAPKYRFHLEQHQEEGLGWIAQLRGVSRDEIVRLAVVAYVAATIGDLDGDDEKIATAGEPDLRSWAHERGAFPDRK
jgi:hypothetical protein